MHGASEAELCPCSRRAHARHSSRTGNVDRVRRSHEPHPSAVPVHALRCTGAARLRTAPPQPRQPRRLGSDARIVRRGHSGVPARRRAHRRRRSSAPSAPSTIRFDRWCFPSTPARPATPKRANASERGIIEPVVDPPPIEWPDSPIEQGSEPTGSGAVSDGLPALPEGIESRGDVFPERGNSSTRTNGPSPRIRSVPEYPRFARDAGIEGVVIVHALVGRDGRVIRVEVDERRSELLLNEAALSAARRWTFQPAMVNGHPSRCGWR